MALCGLVVPIAQAVTSEVEPNGTHEEEENAAYKMQLCVDHCEDVLNLCADYAAALWDTQVTSAKQTYSRFAGKSSSWQTYMSASLRIRLDEIDDSYGEALNDCSRDYVNCVNSCDY